VSKTQSKNDHDPAIRSAGIAPDRTHLGETSPQRRAFAEKILARYPELGREELAELLHWYRREASSMDVALLASNEGIRERYRAFRRDHVEQLGAKAKAITALIALGIAGAAGAVALWEIAA